MLQLRAAQGGIEFPLLRISVKVFLIGGLQLKVPLISIKEEQERASGKNFLKSNIERTE